MRKALKSKALVLLIAWSVIFAHGIVPHNHSDEFIHCCHNLVDSHSQSSELSDKTLLYDSIPSGETVCHYSGFLFLQLNADHIIILSDKAVFQNPAEKQVSDLPEKSKQFISDPHPGSSALRAPPLS